MKKLSRRVLGLAGEVKQTAGRQLAHVEAMVLARFDPRIGVKLRLATNTQPGSPFA